MASPLQDEIKQTKPFRSLRQEAVLAVARTAALTTHALDQSLRCHGITLTQYNVLRILRGARSEGLNRNEVASRMITPVPDVSRLFDRMAEAGLLTRTRGVEDRRVVHAKITDAGLKLLEEFDDPSYLLPNQWLAHLGDDDVRKLIELLERARMHLPRASG